ncbi:endo alpha-1,4 polygalactosaminidase [Hydrogenophaga sp. 5NK40-0174]|uniref:endo alpha-1,4 polygalactosaminidase n=1 Tax=Hydrogenophaga sp. 5NK40-0174 TaxID=3127649 RepID=UPI003108630C
MSPSLVPNETTPSSLLRRTHMAQTIRHLAAVSLVTAAALLSACGGSSSDEADAQETTPNDTQAGSEGNSDPGASPDGTGEAAAEEATAAPSNPNAILRTTTSGKWSPNVNETWQWQLTGSVDTAYNVAVYDIDLFDTPASKIAAIRSAGSRVVCYFSAGSAENWRSDYGKFTSADKGNPLDGWAGERWVDTRSASVRSIMRSRLDLAKAKGCDGVEPDNVDAWDNNPGFNGALTKATQLDYNTFLANEAHARGLLIGLKNDIDQVAALAGIFDFAVNEQCHQYNECGAYSAFTSRGKPVFNAEYRSAWVSDATARAQLCARARAANIRTLVLPLSLNNSFRYSCD